MLLVASIRFGMKPLFGTKEGFEDPFNDASLNLMLKYIELRPLQSDSKTFQVCM